MSAFEPELGQAIVSNTPWQELEMQSHVEAGISLLADLVAAGDWAKDRATNSGSKDFKTDVFAIRSHCWCDGARPGHEDGCPPNFECDDFKACWYKHLHRSATQSRPIEPDEWWGIVKRCGDSIAKARA